MAEEMRGANDFQWIGKSWAQVDGLAKAKGETVYADDMFLPRMLYAKMLRSPHPHARIKSIDVSQALNRPGVVVAMTGKDVPIPYGILPVSQDEEALCVNKVRMIGDPVAAVAALDEETAEAALEDIVVEYELLPSILSIEDGLKELEESELQDAQIHEYADSGNIHKQVALEFGDTEAGFAEADFSREELFYYEGNTHLPMEQHAAVAQHGADGRVTLWSSTQTPHYVHIALAKVLEMPTSQIRVIATPVGGGFGGKTDPFQHEIVVCKLAMMTGRPVKMTLTREEVFYAHRGRHPVLMWVKAGMKSDGSITALHFRNFLDGGAYGSYGVASTFYTGALQTVTYPIANYKFEAMRVFTNKAPCGPKRGHGTPQPRFALEVLLDKFAEDLGLDPAELRLRHLVPDNSLTVNHLTVTTNGLGECLRKVTEASEFKIRRIESNSGKGFGLGCGSYLSGAGLPIYWNKMPHSGVQIKIDRGGGVTVFCGSTDIGQGSNSVLAGIVAEELGIHLNNVIVVTADTDLTPVDLGSYSSRVTLMTGNAAIDAARPLREKILTAAAEVLKIPTEKLILRNGKVTTKNGAGEAVSFEDAVQWAEAKFGTLGSVGSYTPPRRGGKFKGAGVGPSPNYSYSACVAEVTCDPETGLYKVDKLWLAHDIGQAINEKLVIGQVEGSAYMGLSEAMMEEQVYRTGKSGSSGGIGPAGLHKIPSMLDYKSLTSLDMPEVETILVETHDPEGPYGAKEAGQGPLLPIMPAIANAIYNAVGVRIDEVPITPEKIFQGLQDLKKGKSGRIGPKTFPQIKFPEPIHVAPPE
ncbi:MAG: molybdopterin-dependent oxidoreductase [SAR324 cluster bacterium]|jgi:4-hydroxybenzoyl-CoA reductase alpha subunit|nr:molybdopterin-dependent oxidoreductase [SAR324 cluster bacterium]MCH2264905.1 molybdopterin-dependent oxidoreductase [SAR324 cluster bacterium]